VKKFLTKKKIITTIIIIPVVILILIFLNWQNNDLVTSEITYTGSKLPSSFNGYTIVQISDLHNKVFDNDQSQLLDMIQKAKPDIIVITGDLIDENRTDISVAVRLSERMLAIAPVFFVPGNQEYSFGKYDEMKSDLQSLGVKILDNETVKLSKNNEVINLAGIQDFEFFYHGLELNDDIRKDFEDKIKNLINGDEGFEILLTHRPEFFDEYAACNLDLVFAGHAHGGQIRLPFVGALFAPGQGFLPKYTKGSYTIGQTTMIVSAGLGNSQFPFRLFDPPEVVITTLHTN
jgi:predicted MPP superfamily phosphohydrolase